MTARFEVANLAYHFVEPWHLDVASELEHNLEKYIVPQGEGRPWYLVINQCPSFLRHGLDSVRHGVKGHGRTPGRFGPTASCCVQHGLKILAASEQVKSLLQVNDEIERTDFEDGLVKEVILDWRDNFNMHLVIPGTSRKATLYMPHEIKGFCHNLAEDLGVFEYELAIVAMTVTLSTQQSIHADRRKEMIDLYEDLLRRTHLRARGTKCLLDGLTSASSTQLRALGGLSRGGHR